VSVGGVERKAWVSLNSVVSWSEDRAGWAARLRGGSLFPHRDGDLAAPVSSQPLARQEMWSDHGGAVGEGRGG
jgi:hypothetical protein